ncbi:protein YgfX [Stutzerimonas kirkiae]|uniref:protein YgfX n=1 Tax=Stutzerimonas kirkiae TaxID=2211392 RepID=UPI0010384F94|nr:protein YgfX [Stutzerimonas kirkiae]TBV08112.1 hypothetical protein DNK08_11260 [Stutzerimonas kirkiae]TBV17569.1 hypothetical protein DNK01_01585 [Stutzerimonas kirkiae]
MSSPASSFECTWQPSRGLLALYLLGWMVALAAVLCCGAPLVLAAVLLLCCLLHAGWCLPGAILLRGPRAWRGLRHDGQGWRLWNAHGGWQGVTLCADTLVSPALVVLRFQRPGRPFAESLCLPADAMSADDHRRLRVLLKFSRHRWAVAE